MGKHFFKFFELDQISFGLCRKETKIVILRNVTPLPVAWRISNLEHLGEDFTVSMMQGTMLPKGEYGLQVHFQPSKPVNIKKAIRIEVRCTSPVDLIIKICVRDTHIHTHTGGGVLNPSSDLFPISIP
jgi:hypothetical protein